MVDGSIQFSMVRSSIAKTAVPGRTVGSGWNLEAPGSAAQTPPPHPKRIYFSVVTVSGRHVRFFFTAVFVFGPPQTHDSTIAPPAPCEVGVSRTVRAGGFSPLP